MAGSQLDAKTEQTTTRWFQAIIDYHVRSCWDFEDMESRAVEMADAYAAMCDRILALQEEARKAGQDQIINHYRIPRRYGFGDHLNFDKTDD